MKSTTLFASILATSALLVGGCDNDVDDTPPPPTEVQTPAPAPDEAFILPDDSKGEGSEPKNSGPFGGALPAEDPQIEDSPAE